MRSRFARSANATASSASSALWKRLFSSRIRLSIPPMPRAMRRRLAGGCTGPNAGGPWIGRSIPENFLIFASHLRLPLPDVPDVAHDDPNRLPIGDHSNPLRDKDNLWKPGDPVKSVPMMKQRMECVASGKIGPYLVFQPVAQIQILMGGARAARIAQHSGTLVGGGTVGSAQPAAMGSHRLPLSSMGGDTVMALLIDPKNGEALLVGGRESSLSAAVDMKS